MSRLTEPGTLLTESAVTFRVRSHQLSSCVELSVPIASVTFLINIIVTIIVIMTPRAEAVAGLAEDVGKALLLFAERLRAEAETTAATEAGTDETRARGRLGGTQAALLEVLAAAGERGMTTTDAAKAVGMAPTNAPRALKALAERGLATASGETPITWRAVPSDE